MGDRHWTVTGPLDANLQCAVCSDGLDEPRKLAGCGHYFCRSCIEAWLRTNATCPIDRHPASLGGLEQPDRLVVAMLGDLRIACSLCDFRGAQSAHQCPQFACPAPGCGFCGADNDHLLRHTERAHPALHPAPSPRARPDKSSSQLAYADQHDDHASDNLLLAGVAFAATLAGGFFLGKALANNSKKERQ
ncbi:hypothetical protein HK100_001960 [Physocladia obscura]|uniref:RING-type domain-containing protein n=1 Tax=Physocladia obscura TaxID=109957 RepID=A0AAD5XEI7_9FUNG|nr:hypothetical protein HK100_001960 [Physocladia obscura]